MVVKKSFILNPKGISVFDFDDTLARTKSNVLYVMPGDPSKVTEKEFSNLSKQEKVYYHGTSAVVDQKFVNKEIVKDFPEGASSFSVQMQGLGKHYTKSLDNAKSFIDHRNREDNTGTVAAVSISANNPKQFKTYQDLLNDIKSTVKNKDISISFENSGNYDVLLYVENDFGCSDEIIHSVQVDDEFNVFVPTAFTPNNDGLNDVFEVKGNGVSTFQIRIYNRWGGLVFFSENLEIGWNGIEETSGEVLDNGTYLYNIHVTDYNKKLWVYNGELNLMK